MGTMRRKFTLEFKTEAAHRVIDTGRSVAEVAAELSVVDSSLARGYAMSDAGWRRWRAVRMSR